MVKGCWAGASACASEIDAKGASIVSAKKLRAMEPNTSPDALVVLSVLSSGVRYPYGPQTADA